MQPLAIVLAALATVAVATALGEWLLGDACRNEATRFVTGSAILSLSVFLLCAAGWLYPWVLTVVGMTAVGSRLFVPAVRRERKMALPRYLTWLFAAVFAVFFVIYLVNAMAPEASPDGAGYHLGLVGRYFRAHGFHRITDNLYAALSQGAEMLFLFAYAYGDNPAAALVHLAFLVALVWQMFRYGLEAGFPLGSACAALLVFASPVVGIDGSSAYNDVALAAVAFTLFYLLQLWEVSRSRRLLAAVGLMAGFAYAVKYTGVLAIPYALILVWWKSRSVRQTAAAAAFSASMVLPWILKNWFWYRNPIAPFFNYWFQNPYVTAEFESEYWHQFTHYGLASKWQIPMQVTVHGELSGLVGPVFLIAPLALLAVRRREGRRLLLAALIFGATYFSNIGTRFLIPPLPFLALALSLVLAVSPGLVLAVALLHAVLSWPGIISIYE